MKEQDVFESRRVEFIGSGGDVLAARLEKPIGRVRAYAIFVHCFTCSKDIFASHRIASELAQRGIATLRFDFTGLGTSGGEFANTNFSSNTEDIRLAARYLAAHHGPAEILIGHSLGGAAVLATASDLPEVKSVVVIAAPAGAEHVLETFRVHVPTIEARGEADVELAGRTFKIRRQFLDDVRSVDLKARVHSLNRPLLIVHSPTDDVVDIDNARQIFKAARHPKSFISLDGADHLLSRRSDARFVADFVCAWCSRYIKEAEAPSIEGQPAGVITKATGRGRFQQEIMVGAHNLLADEPSGFGGSNSGPSPYDLLAAALGSCTSMTLGLYAERKGLTLPPFSVAVGHAKVHAEDCVDCVEGAGSLIDRFEVKIAFETDPGPDARAKTLEIAGKCPVHRTLTARAHIDTSVSLADDEGT